ncbi:MAG TPA: hypothetical protein VFE79_06380 [Paraburkholderia sp.]|nr:hypothetical protein [Paraburkholderia sp.]
MKALLRAVLVAAVVALPTAAFAQSSESVQGDATEVQIVAYEVVDTAPEMALPVPSVASSYSPALNAGLKSIYVGH